MNETLLDRSQLPAPDATFVSEDKQSLLEFYINEPMEDGGSVAVYQQKPEEMEPFEAMKAFNPNRDEEIRDLLLDIGYSGSIVYFGEIAYYPELVRGLGYRWNMEESLEDGIPSRLITFDYPSVKSLNAILDEISPGEGMRYAEFQGGSYTAIDWAEAFIDKKALIASEQPYQLHDHVALHALGSLGLHGELLDNLRSFTEAYLARYRAELLLPSVPNMNNRHISPYLHPSHQVLRSLLRQMDGMTGSIGDAVFMPEQTGQGVRLIPRLESAMRSVYYLGNLRDHMPSVIDEPDYETMLRYVAQTEARYNKLSAAIIRIAA